QQLPSFERVAPATLSREGKELETDGRAPFLLDEYPSAEGVAAAGEDGNALGERRLVGPARAQGEVRAARVRTTRGVLETPADEWPSPLRRRGRTHRDRPTRKVVVEAGIEKQVLSSGPRRGQGGREGQEKQQRAGKGSHVDGHSSVIQRH